MKADTKVPAFFVGKKMGNTGQGTSNGGGGGASRVAAASNATSNLSQMQALAQKSGTAADQQLASMLSDATSRMLVQVDDNQQDTDTQRFVNATGIADKKPRIAKSEDELDAMKFRGETVGVYIYHTDAATSSVRDAKTFGDQYQRGRMYFSSGVYGDGAYFSSNTDGSWSYGYGRGYQLKGMLNDNARVIDYSALTRKITAFKRSHPAAARVIRKMSTGYGGQDGQKAVYALLFGYNVIRKPNATYRPGEHYYAVLDRSATTVVKKGIHQGSGETWKKT